MILFGTIVNTVGVLGGGLIGLVIHKLLHRGIPTRYSERIMQGIGLCTIYIAASSLLDGSKTLVTVLSMVLGVVIGELLGLDGRITRIRRDDTAVWYTIQAGPEILRYVVEKGSVTVDGISRTVASGGTHGFAISAIPHTVAQTVLRERREGDPVNLETDIIGKYVEKLLAGDRRGQAPGSAESRITREFLTQYDF